MHATEWVSRLVRRAGFDVRRRGARREFRDIPDARFYTRLFSPWEGYGDFGALEAKVRPYTLVSPDRLYVLHSLAQQAKAIAGELWECGVYRGGTAMLLQASLQDGGVLRLFDTFEGLPATSPIDAHHQGEFSDTSIDAVRARLAQDDRTALHPGRIPESFAGLETSRIALAHIDVDLERSVLDCCAFIYPRMVSGGFMIFDDYGFPSCVGARQAVDRYFSDKPEIPLVLPTGQAVVFIAPRT